MERVTADGVEVRIKRTNGKTCRFRVLRTEHAVSLNVPSFLSSDYVKTKADEIVAESRKNGKLNDLRDGGFIVLFGEKVPLCVYDADEYSIAFCNGKIYLGLVDGRIGYHARKTVFDFYRRRLFETLKERVPVMENLVGISCKGWRINGMCSAWGNCNYLTGELAFSVNLATQPPECVDMVIVHELGHIRYHDHGKNFYEFMDRYVPGHTRLRAKMKDY
ncbi:MAG: M48 family metallopeptidase [Christensenellales bacterium]